MGGATSLFHFAIVQIPDLFPQSELGGKDLQTRAFKALDTVRHAVARKPQGWPIND
jgi:hypothetical protein